MWMTIWYSSVSLSSVVLLWVCLSHPAIRPFVHFLVLFFLLLAIETLNVNDNMIFKCVTIVSCFAMGVSFPPSNKAICSFFSTFPLIAGYWDYECEWRHGIQVCQVSTNNTVSCFYMGVFSHSIINSFVHFLTFPLITGYWDYEYEWWYDIQVCQVSTNNIISSFDMGVSFSPGNMAICSFFSTFLLLLAIETMNVNEDMIFKSGKSVQIILSVVLIWMHLSHLAERPFVHFLVHFSYCWQLRLWMWTRIWYSSVAS